RRKDQTAGARRRPATAPGPALADPASPPGRLRCTDCTGAAAERVRPGGSPGHGPGTWRDCMRGMSLRLAPVPSLGVALGLLAACASTPDVETAALPAPPPGGGYIADIRDEAVDNADYRRVLVTGPHLQLVLMTLRPGEEIGGETHENGDPFVRVQAGTGPAPPPGA